MKDCIFNNNPTKRLLKRAYKESFIIFCCCKTVKKSLQIAKKCRRYGKKYSSYIVIWYYPGSNPTFERFITSRIDKDDPIWYAPLCLDRGSLEA